MKHFTTWLQLILLTQQFSRSKAVCILIQINSTLEQLIQRMVAWEWRRSQITKTVNTPVWSRMVAVSCWLTLTVTQSTALHLSVLSLRAVLRDSLFVFVVLRSSLTTTVINKKCTEIADQVITAITVLCHRRTIFAIRISVT